MNVTVLLFAGLQDHFGTTQLSLKLADAASIADVQASLQERCPAAEPLLRCSVMACNEQHVGAQHTLQHGDVIAALPPMSGG